MSEEISKETYQKKRSEIESNIEELQTKIENCMNADEDSAVSLERKVAALKSVMEQDFDFDTGNIPDSIIDAFVDHIKVYKDKFVWKLNFLDTDVTCLASGTRKKHEVSIVDFPSSVYGSTGSNQRGTLIEPTCFLGTFEIPKDFMRKSGKLYYGEHRAFRFPEKLEFKLFLV